MLITHYGHACVLVEMDGVRALIDPGTYARGFEELRDLGVILVTHEHADHLDLDRLPALLERNPEAQVITISAVAEKLPAGAAVLVVEPGETVQLGGLSVEAVGVGHSVIHPLVPNVPNTGFVLGGRIWHPGDSFDYRPRTVEVLLIPVGGPWMRLQEAIDFERDVAPATVVPIHEAGLSELHKKLHYQLLAGLAPEGTAFLPLAPGVPTEV